MITQNLSRISRWRASNNLLVFQTRYFLGSESKYFFKDGVGVLTRMRGTGQVGGFQVACFNLTR